MNEVALKQMRQLSNAAHLTDDQCLRLHAEMQAINWGARVSDRFRPDYVWQEVGYQKARWLIDRVRALHG